MLGFIILLYAVSANFIYFGVNNMPKKKLIETETHPRMVELYKNPL